MQSKMIKRRAFAWLLMFFICCAGLGGTVLAASPQESELSITVTKIAENGNGSSNFGALPEKTTESFDHVQDQINQTREQIDQIRNQMQSQKEKTISFMKIIPIIAIILLLIVGGVIVYNLRANRSTGKTFNTGNSQRGAQSSGFDAPGMQVQEQMRHQAEQMHQQAVNQAEQAHRQATEQMDQQEIQRQFDQFMQQSSTTMDMGGFNPPPPPPPGV